MSGYENVTFISDFGLGSESVGICKSVIVSMAPQVNVIDLSHDVPVFDVRGASLMLVRAANHLLPGVVLGAINPGAGSSRAVAIELGDGESVLVGPDNGLFAPVTAVTGGATRAVEIVNAEASSVQSISRDVYAPAVAKVCNGIDIAELGNAIDTTTLVPGLLPFSGQEAGVLHADVVRIDRYGNVQLNVTPQQLVDYGNDIVITYESERWGVKRVSGLRRATTLSLINDADGLVSLVINEDSAAARHRFVVGGVLSLQKGLPIK